MRTHALLSLLLVTAACGASPPDEPPAVSSCGAQPCPSEPGQAGPVQPLSETPASVQYPLPLPGKVDAFRFSAVAGRVYHLVFELEPGSQLEVSLTNESLQQPPFTWRTASEKWTLLLEALSTGPYLVTVKSLGASWEGHYRLRLRDMGTDDHGNTITSATVVATFPSTQEGRIDYTYDSDVFAIHSLAGHGYRLWCEPLDAANAYRVDLTWVDPLTPRPPVGSCGAQETLVAEWWAPGAAPEFVWVDGDVGVAYRLRVEDMGADDRAADGAAATPLTLGTPMAGRIEISSDRDGFRVELEQQHLYRLSSTVSDGVSVSYTVLGPDGARIAESEFLGLPGTQPLAFETRQAGRYVIQVWPRDRGVGDYGVRLDALGVDDHGDEPATATPLHEGVEASALLETTTDRDVFVIQAQAGHVYNVHCVPEPGTFASLSLRDSAGNYLDGLTCQQVSSNTVAARLERTGPMFLEVYWDLNTQPYATPFRITLEDVGTDEHGDTVAQATVLGADGVGTGALQLRTDHDVFVFTPPAGELFGVTLSSDPQLNLRLIVRDAAGQVVPGGPGWPQAKARATGERYSAEIDGPSAGPYTLRVEQAGADDHGDTDAAATALVRGVATAGVIDVITDRDVFWLQLEAGEEAHLELLGSWWLYLHARAPDGSVVATYSPGNGGGPFTAAVSGRYTFSVAVDTVGYGDGRYTLRVW